MKGRFTLLLGGELPGRSCRSHGVTQKSSSFENERSHPLGKTRADNRKRKKLLSCKGGKSRKNGRSNAGGQKRKKAGQKVSNAAESIAIGGGTRPRIRIKQKGSGSVKKAARKKHGKRTDCGRRTGQEASYGKADPLHDVAGQHR